MRQSVRILIEEAKTKWSAYASLLSYRLMNICVKAEPASLLSFMVEYEDEKYKFEEVAHVTIPREDQFRIYPMDKAYILPICKGLKTSHPEFKTDIQDPEDPNDKDATKTILCTMPEVNKDRHDTMKDAVNLLATECEDEMKISHEKYKVELEKRLVGETDENRDEAKNELQEAFEAMSENCAKTREEKDKEIDDAYQRYLQAQTAQQQQQQEEDAAKGQEVSRSMKMDATGEDDY